MDELYFCLVIFSSLLVVLLTIMGGVTLFRLRGLRQANDMMQGELRRMGEALRRVEGTLFQQPKKEPATAAFRAEVASLADERSTDGDAVVHDGPEDATASVARVVPPPVPPRGETAPPDRLPPRISPAMLAASRAAQPASQTQAMPAPASGRFETAAREILAKVWNWIVVGEEHRPKNVTMEYAVATTWMLRVGVLILVIGIGFFLNYSIARGMIGPLGRVLLTAGVAAGLLWGGLKLIQGRYAILGHGLSGAGVATLFFTLFASYQLKLMGLTVTLASFMAVAALSGWLALRYQSLLIAVLGVLGGYITPLLFRQASDHVPLFYGYLTVLSLGVLFVASRRQWHLLYYLGFACTWLLTWGKTVGDHELTHFAWHLGFGVAFFVIYSTVTFSYHLIHRKKTSALELLFLFLNAGMFLGYTSYVVGGQYGKRSVAVVTVLLAIFYLAHIAAIQYRSIVDRGLMLSFIGLAAFFAAVTLPLMFSQGWITVSWSLQALVMLWIATKMRSEFLRHLAYLLYVLVFARMVALDYYQQFQSFEETAQAGAYWSHWLSRVLNFGIPILSFFAAGKLAGVESGEDSAWTVERGNDIKPMFGTSPFARVMFWTVLLTSFVYLQLEVWNSATYAWEPMTRPAITLLWLVYAGVLFRETLAKRGGLAEVLFVLLMVMVSIKVLFVDPWYWNPGWRLAWDWEEDGAGWIGAGLRCLNYGAVIFFCGVVWQQGRQGKSGRGWAKTFGYLALATTFVYSTAELWSVLNTYLSEFRHGGLSIFWSVFALTLLVAGIVRGVVGLRSLALILLGLVVTKVFFIDLAGLGPLFRIIAFITLGIVVLIGSFVYLKFREKFEMTPSVEVPPLPQSGQDGGTS